METQFSTGKTIRHIIIYILLFLAGDLFSGLLFDLLFLFVKLPIRGLYYIPRALGCLILTYILFWLYTTKVLHLKMRDFGITFSIKKWGIILAIFLPAFVVIGFLLIGKAAVDELTFDKIFIIISYSLIMALRAGILEEILFRGYIMKLLESRWNKYVAILFPSILFSLSHIPSMETISVAGVVLLVISGTLVGVMFSLVAYKGESVSNSIVIHSVWNFVMVTDILRITTEEGTYGGSIFSITIPSDNILLTGGGFGVEASIVAIIGYLFVCCIAIWRKKKFLTLFPLLLLLTCLTGCSGKDTADSQLPADTEVNVAVFDRISDSIDGMFTPMLMEDSLYYWKGDWDKDSKRWSNTAIYRKSGGEAEAVVIADLEDKQLLYFTVDEEQNLYCLYAEYGKEEKNMFLKKDSPDGGMLYNVPVSEEAATQILYDIDQNGYFDQGTVDPLGEVIIRGKGGSLYLFDEKGEFICIGSDGWDAEKYQGADIGLVNAGHDGIFTYAVKDQTISLSKINMANASLSAAEEVTVDTAVSLDVFSGYDRGILVSDSDSLRAYDPAGRELNVLLNWGDDNVSLKAYDIRGIAMLQDGRLYVMMRRSNGQSMELAYIETLSSDAVTEKQTVVIGMYQTINESETSGLGVLAEDFNKYNQQYQVEIRQYSSSQEMYMELLKGEGPDGFQMTHSSVLASKGVLEDLSPYFEKSSVVQETDLLPSVRNAGSKDGKLLYLFTQFRLRGLIMGQGAADNGVWTPEEYLGLGEQYPEALLAYPIEPSMIMMFTVSADMESFLDWQERKCYFDSERFIGILESIRQVTDGKQDVDDLEYRTNACRWLHDGEILTDRFFINDWLRYVEYRDAYKEFASFAGYPNSKGVPYYCFDTYYVLAMNSASENKEGVWAFLEFLLSKERQSSLCSSRSSIRNFPVRQDVFDAYIDDQFENWEDISRDYTMNTVSLEKWTEPPKVSEEDKELLIYMVQNAYWDDTFDEIWRILTEETGSFWAGDKTAAEAAGIIQNRVQLYLDEV